MKIAHGASSTAQLFLSYLPLFDVLSVLTISVLRKCAGAMIAMSPTITVKGNVSFGLKKMLAGGMTESEYTGPGELLLAPSVLGDIILLKLDGKSKWTVGRDAFLAATIAVEKDYKTQKLAKGLFSGEGFFVYHISGQGIVWLQSFGAILRKDVSFISASVRRTLLTVGS